MHAQRLGLGHIDRVVPCASGQLYHAGHHVGGHLGAGQTRTTVIEEAHDVAIGNATLACIIRMQAAHLALATLARLAVSAKIELAVQSGGGLVGHQLQGVLCRRWIDRRQPGGMTGAIRVTERSDAR